MLRKLLPISQLDRGPNDLRIANDKQEVVKGLFWHLLIILYFFLLTNLNFSAILKVLFNHFLKNHSLDLNLFS